MEKKPNKIFCIGLNKTGTTSLHKAFEILGYKSAHYFYKEGTIKNVIKNNYLENKPLLSKLEEFDVIIDWNNEDTNNLYKIFDKQYPNSKFILNTRDLNSWLISREKHVLKIPNLKEKQVKYPNNTWYNLDKKSWTKVYNEHHHDVLEYFKLRPDDLLVYNIFTGDKWEKLCSFLNKDIPQENFPSLNKAKSKTQTLINYLKKFIKRIKLNSKRNILNS